MKIGLIQINPVIGDFAGNCRKIRTFAQKAYEKGCRLAVFPEMVVSGYPPQDLLERRAFIEEHDRELLSLISELPPIYVLLGSIERRNRGKGKHLYNSALGIHKGQIVFKARKRLLPSYDVFDEKRYFEPGPPTTLFEVDNLSFAVTVCEDIWHGEVDEYITDPVKELFTDARQQENKIEAVINISSSPFQRGKEQVRHTIFSSICTTYDVPFLYVNQVGGQDSLLFDGRSMAMDRKGGIVAKAEGFTEGIVVVDSQTWTGEIQDKLDEDEVATVCSALVMGVRDYVTKCGFSQVVLGLSGGIDSALTAAIAAKALGAENVLGVALPSPYSSADSLEDAQALAKNLGCKFEVLPISDLFQTFQTCLKPLFNGLDEDLTEQNIQARIRGNLLMALSNKFGSLLLTTGNKSEMAVGYCTLYGDMSGGLAVISDVPKQLVYELSRYLNGEGEVIPERTIIKAPTAELKPDQCDQDDLPPYEILDQILEMHLEKGDGLEEIVTKGFEKNMVKDVLRRVKINEYKRKQAPMGLKVTSKAFGYGRRYPNVQNFTEK